MPSADDFVNTAGRLTGTKRSHDSLDAGVVLGKLADGRYVPVVVLYTV